jgi:DNA (cytosine-5)-methyltransferase 1
MFGSVCSGIEAASVAWNPLGWKSAFFSEIEPFPCAVLAHHYPNTPNLGDMTGFKDWPDANLDVLCGGTPCQSFSNAGLRAGLDDPRGQLMLTFGAIAARYRPKWLVWENVPGVLSSNGGRDFGSFLGLLGFLGYGFAYRVLDAQYVRVDGYGRAVPQRRNRVFVVGCLGDWRSAAAVLLERESLRGDSAPRRVSGARVAGTSSPGAHPSGFNGQDAYNDRLVTGALAGNGPGAGWRIGADEAAAGQVVVVAGTLTGGASMGGMGPGGCIDGAPHGHLLAFGGNNTRGPVSVSSALSAHGGAGRMDFESETFIAHTLRGEGFDASEDGTGRGTPLVPVNFQTRGSNIDLHQGVAGTMGQNIDRASGGAPCVAFNARQDPINGPIDCDGGSNGVMVPQFGVRRLMPEECELLQGFERGYTRIPLRNSKGLLTGKFAKDGPRYKALGNSWAVNCPRWIGRRIDLVEGIHAARLERP